MRLVFAPPQLHANPQLNLCNDLIALLRRCRMEISELREKRSELATLRQDMDKIGLQNEELKADLLKCETELNQHKTSAREKLR